MGNIVKSYVWTCSSIGLSSLRSGNPGLRGCNQCYVVFLKFVHNMINQSISHEYITDISQISHRFLTEIQGFILVSFSNISRKSVRVQIPFSDIDKVDIFVHRIMKSTAKTFSELIYCLCP